MKIKIKKSPGTPGFKAAGISCGIKGKGIKDLALIVSDPPAVAAGVFTLNQVRAAPVVLSESHLKGSGKISAIITNSGNANAATGKQGMKDCRTSVNRLAKELGIKPKEILVGSTGVIGVPLPVNKIVKGIPKLVDALSSKGWNHAARAMMTTDLASKSCAVEYLYKGKKIVLSGIAKGSGMIHPNMATMLAYVTTNVSIDKKMLSRALKSATDNSFNKITVDNECSTNDSVFVLANGLAGNKTIKSSSAEYSLFVDALTQLCKILARKIVQDGEGATKLVTVKVKGARTEKDADQVARIVANSMLVKTAIFGADPNWGRIMGAIGYAGVKLNLEKIDISLNSTKLVRKGLPVAGVSLSALKKQMKRKEVDITIGLNLGKGEVGILTCDLSYDYVRINAEYTT